MNNVISFDFDKLIQCKQQYAGEYIVIKYGGSIAARADHVRAIAKQAAFIQNHIGAKVIIVHGGKEQADIALIKAGFDPNDKDPETGLRITTKAMMPVFEEALCTLNMSNIMTMNISVGQSIFKGISGYEHRIVRAEPIKDCTGEVSFVRGDRIHEYYNGKIPVFYPVCLDDSQNGQVQHLNVNADNMATAIAHAVGAKRLLLLSDIDAVIDANGQSLKTVCDKKAVQLIEDGIASGGMIAKLNNAVKAAKSLPNGKVVILNGQKPDTIIREILCNEGAGTMVTYEPAQKTMPKPAI